MRECVQGSQLRPNRWRGKECEQKVSNVEELIVLLNVSLQFFFFASYLSVLAGSKFCHVYCTRWPVYRRPGQNE